MTAALALALALTAAGPKTLDEGAPARVYDPLDTEDMEALARRLLTHVALLEVEIDAAASIGAENPRTGFAAVMPDGRLVALAHLLDGGAKVTVVGPKGRAPAKVVLADRDRRVAVLAPTAPLARLGLAPTSGWVPKAERETGMDVLSLVSTLHLAGVSRGVLTHTGALKEYEGYPRVDLELERGMPVFDAQARLLGFSRVVAWDVDRHMIVPQEKIEAALAAREAKATPTKKAKKAGGERPWWARPLKKAGDAEEEER